jgi:hypothetical protein
MRKRPLRHGASYFLTHGTVRLNQRGWHTQHVCFGGIGISDKAPFKPEARASQVSAGGRYHAARATLSGTNAELLQKQNLSKISTDI